MSILLPILAVLFGYAVTYFIKSGAHATQLLLSYSGALLLSVTIFEFLPEVYQSYSPATGLLIMAGILLQVFLEFMSKGAEHGHLHNDETRKSFPILLFLSLCIHSFMEGFPITTNPHLLLGVVVHKIPIAIIISSFLMNSEMSKTKIAFFLIIFALMTPLGSIFNQTLVTSALVEHYIQAVVIGIFLHVSTTILFETSRDHRFNWSKIILIVLGVATAYFI